MFKVLIGVLALLALLVIMPLAIADPFTSERLAA